MKERLIQENLHLVREILEGLKDSTKAALINLDQSKAFDRVSDDCLETVGIQAELYRCISMMYHNAQAVVQVNGKGSEAFAIERSVWQGCFLSPLPPCFGVPAS